MSGLDGSHLREVAQGIADLLSFAVVDEEIILRAAADGGVEPKVVADAEKRRSFIERAIDALGSSSDATAFAFSGGIGGYLTAEAPISDDAPGADSLRDRGDRLPRRRRHRLARSVARHRIQTGSSPRPRHRVAAGASRARCGRTRAEREGGGGRSSSRQTPRGADYLKRFYGTKTEAPTQYDLVVNTDRLSIAEAASVVASVTGR